MAWRWSEAFHGPLYPMRSSVYPRAVCEMDSHRDRRTISEIVARLQEQVVGHRVRYESDSIWVGGWEAMKEVEKALEGFRRNNEPPVLVAVAIIIDALLERDPTASRPPVTRKKSPSGVAPPEEAD